MIKNYLLTAYHVYMRRKLFTAINLLCITITLTVLLVVTAMLQNAFYPTGVEGRSDHFLQVTTLVETSADGQSSRIGPLGYKTIERYLQPMKSAQLVAAVTNPETVSVYQGDRVNEVMLRRADANYWKILDFKLLDGRLPTAEDDSQGRFVAVINAATAAKLLPGQRAVGKTLDIGGQQMQVIGVVANEMQLNAYADVWVPISTNPSTEYKSQMSGNFNALLMGRDASDVPRIKAEVADIAARMKLDDPVLNAEARMWADSKPDFFARGLLNNERQPDSGAGTLMAIIVVAMLMFMLLPALNLVNLNTGRIMERSAEIGVRKAFGASSSQLVVQFVVENVLLSVFGGLLSLVFAKGALVWLEGSGLVPYLKVEINLAVFACGLLLALAFGLLSGVIPAWRMSRLHPVHALKGAA